MDAIGSKGPEVRLWLGRGLNASRIKRGSDVFFECVIDTALPDWILKRDHDVSWLKDGIALNPQGLLRGTGEIYNGHADTTGGGYLVLRNVTGRDEGNYSCRVGSRLHKRTFISTSNRIHIRIQYPPRCRWRSVQTIWVDVLSPAVSLRCESATDINRFGSGFRYELPDRFRWRIGSREFCERSPSLHIADARHLLHHSIHCWAYNWVGMQPYPCVFHLLPKPATDGSSPAEIPNKHCRVTDPTERAVAVECNEEVGLVTAKEVYSGRRVFAMTVRERRVTVTSLRPGTLHVLNAGGQLFHVTTKAFSETNNMPWVTLLNWMTSQAYLTVLVSLCTLSTGFVLLLLLRRFHARWKHQVDGVSMDVADDHNNRLYHFAQQRETPPASQ